ncbi:hypothetical protein PNIG_b0141 [Pseudoalteromonas nigrifaciens]|uniref:Uncharacterized protein n=1 Tax=Pseudoalteromonas nigrifaciens TaxID=28109 RepID=A0AAC9XYV7_9GAMM|nr:hypothetical protein PNIG_b0141 [Pseudoalteromonas nigrifaciens]
MARTMYFIFAHLLSLSTFCAKVFKPTYSQREYETLRF